MYDLGGKLFSRNESMYIDSLSNIRIKMGEREWFRINSGVREVYHVPLTVQCIYGCSDEGGEKGKGVEGSEIP